MIPASAERSSPSGEPPRAACGRDHRPRDVLGGASNLVADLERYVDPVLVGEPMGGGLNFWNDVTWVHLDRLPVPIQVGISTRYWQPAEDPADPRLTVEPDVPVTVTADDYFAGRDPALRAALGDLP